MGTRTILIALSASAMTASSVHAASVSLGNLTVYNSPLTILNFNGPAGGTYTKFVYTTNWSYGFGTATSNASAWSLGNPSTSIVSAFTSVTGLANNGNSTTITIAGNLSVGVTSATSLQFVGSQNPFSIGNFSVSAFWSSTTLNFYEQKPLPPIPTGIINMGVFHPPSGNEMSIDTGGSTFTPSVAIFAEDGLLLGANTPDGQGLPGTALELMTLRAGVYYVFAAGEGATFGPEDLDVSVPPGAPGGTLGGGINGVPWPDPVVPTGEGRWYSITVAPPACPGDIDGDGDTDVFDFAILASNFGQSFIVPFTNGDINGDGTVNVLDFGTFAGNFGCGALR